MPEGYKHWILSSTPLPFEVQKGKKGHPFVAASFNEQSVKGNDIACKCHKTSTFRKDNDVDLFFDTETWLSA